MSNKTSKEDIEFMRRLRKEYGFSLARIAAMTGVSAETARTYVHLIDELGYDSAIDYYTFIAQDKGFDSLQDYQQHCTQQRQQQAINRVFSTVVRARLQELGKNPLWLAREMKVTKSMGYRYAKGTNLPRKELQRKLFKVLKLKYNSIDELLEN